MASRAMSGRVLTVGWVHVGTPHAVPVHPVWAPAEAGGVPSAIASAITPAAPTRPLMPGKLRRTSAGHKRQPHGVSATGPGAQKGRPMSLAARAGPITE